MRKERKLLYAKEAVRAVARNLKDNDLLGVIGFDKVPFVVTPLGEVGKHRDELLRRVARLKASGGTALMPALLEAKRQLEREQAQRKHVIVLTDGETGGSGSQFLDLATAMRQELKITISTIAVGSQPNLRLLSRLAEYGGGAFHHTQDPRTLPDIFLGEIEEKPKEKTMVERLLTPIPDRASPLLARLPAPRLPAIKGYVQTELKRGARRDAAVRDEGRLRPLLASWTYGRGKVVAFTSDASGRWSAPWLRWRGFGRFWNGLVRWTLADRKEPGEGFSVDIGRQDGAVFVEVFSRREVEGERPTVTEVTRPSGQQDVFVLDRLAPGHYRGAVEAPQPGTYRFVLTLPTGERLGPLAYTVSATGVPEAPRPRPNLELLEALARVAGTALVTDAASLPRSEGPPERRPLLPYVAALAMALYLADLTWRRLA
jgi:hypothetical protein